MTVEEADEKEESMGIENGKRERDYRILTL